VREPLASNTAGSGRGPWYLAKAKALAVGLSNECVLQIAGASIIVRGLLAQPSRTAVYGPYARWCGRGRRVTAGPVPITAANSMPPKTQEFPQNSSALPAEGQIQL
jgi:hypothetical protein